MTEEIIQACHILAMTNDLRIEQQLSVSSVLGGFFDVFFGVGSNVTGMLGSSTSAGVIGSVGLLHSRDRRKTVSQVISNEMSASQKERLAAAIKRAIREAGLSQETFLANFVVTNGEVRDVVITELGRFMQSEFQYTVSR